MMFTCSVPASVAFPERTRGLAAGDTGVASFGSTSAAAQRRSKAPRNREAKLFAHRGVTAGTSVGARGRRPWPSDDGCGSCCGKVGALLGKV